MGDFRRGMVAIMVGCRGLGGRDGMGDKAAPNFFDSLLKLSFHEL